MRQIKMPTVCYKLDCFACACGGGLPAALCHKEWVTAFLFAVFAFAIHITSNIINRKYERSKHKVHRPL
jgi:hypothetical protein